MTLADRVLALPRPLLLALDVDGTLAPIALDPSRARVPEGVEASLRALCDREGLVVALVTGRDAAQLDRVVRLERAWRVLEHGRMTLAPGRSASESQVCERLDALDAWARREVVPRGARLERKRASVAVHVRELALRDEALAQAILSEVRLEARARGLFARDGRAVVEVELDEADKSHAVLELLERTGAAGLVYAGDDLTDLPAIQLASKLGIGIFVGSSERTPPPTKGVEILDGPGALAALLEELAAR